MEMAVLQYHEVLKGKLNGFSLILYKIIQFKVQLIKSILF